VIATQGDFPSASHDFSEFLGSIRLADGGEQHPILAAGEVTDSPGWAGVVVLKLDRQLEVALANPERIREQMVAAGNIDSDARVVELPAGQALREAFTQPISLQVGAISGEFVGRTIEYAIDRSDGTSVLLQVIDFHDHSSDRDFHGRGDALLGVADTIARTLAVEDAR